MKNGGNLKKEIIRTMSECLMGMREIFRTFLKNDKWNFSQQVNSSKIFVFHEISHFPTIFRKRTEKFKEIAW